MGKDETFRNIINCSYCMEDDAVWDSISDEAQELIEKLLVFHPDERWTVHEALQCDWIKNNMDYLTAGRTTEKEVRLSTDVPHSSIPLESKRECDSFKSTRTETSATSTISYDSL